MNSVSMPDFRKTGPLQDKVKLSPVIVGGVWREVFEQDRVNAARDIVAVAFVHRLACVILQSKQSLNNSPWRPVSPVVPPGIGVNVHPFQNFLTL